MALEKLGDVLKGHTVDAIVRGAKNAPAVTRSRGAVDTRKFEKLSPPEQRVAIAKDVLAQLDEKSLYAQSGSYVGASVDTIAEPLGRFAKQEVCSVCAIGAVVISYVRRGGNARMRAQNLDATHVPKGLRAIFPSQMLLQMEELFEGYYPHEKTLEHLADDEKLRVIMQNLVDNGGELKFETLGTE